MTTRVLTAFLLLFTLFCRAQENPDVLRRNLDGVYQSWRAAMIKGDLAAYQATTSAFRQAVTQNMIVSQKQPFPQALFAIPLTPPSMSGLHFLDLKSRSAFAQLTYWGDLQMDAADPQKVAVIALLRFQVEQTGWKYDSMRLIQMDGNPEISAMARRGDAGFLNDPGLALPERAVAPPPVMPEPDHVAVLEVNAPGASATATFHGVDYPTVSDSSGRDLLMGGLRNGENKLTVRAQALPDARGKSDGVEVTLLILPSKGQGESRRVWSKKLPFGTSEIRLQTTPAGAVTEVQ